MARRPIVNIDDRDVSLDQFQAQGVPHVGPQRFGDKGAPYEQMANALGRFNQNLQFLGKSTLHYMTEKKKKENKGLGDQITALTRGMTTEQRNNVSAQGFPDPLQEGYKNAAEFEYNTLNDMDKAHTEFLAKAEADGWEYTDKDGNRKPMDRQYFVDQQAARAKDFFDSDAFKKAEAEGTFTDKEMKKLGSKLRSQEDELVKKSGSFFIAKREKQAVDNATYMVNEHVENTWKTSKDPQENLRTSLAKTAETYRENRGTDTDMKSQPVRDTVVRTWIKGQEDAVGSDPVKAQQFLKMVMSKPSDDTGALAEIPRYQADIKPVLKKALETLDKDRFAAATAERQAQVREAILTGKDPEAFKDVVVQHWDGNGKYSKPVKEIIAEEARKHEAEIDAKYRVSENPQLAPKADQEKIGRFVGTGMIAQSIKDKFEKTPLSLDSVQNDQDGVYDNLLSTFNEIKKADRTKLKDYVPNTETRIILDTTADIIAANPTGTSVQDALTRALQWRDMPAAAKENIWANIGVKKDDARKFIRNEIGSEQGINPTEMQRMLDRIEVETMVRGPKDKSEMKELIKKVAKDSKNDFVTINGKHLSNPTDIPADKWKAEYATPFIKQFADQEKVPGGAENITVESTQNGFYLTRKDTGEKIKVKAKNGNVVPAYYPHAALRKHMDGLYATQRLQRVAKNYRAFTTDPAEIERQKQAILVNQKRIKNGEIDLSYSTSLKKLFSGD